MRVAVSEELSAFIAARVAGFPTEATGPLLYESPFVAEFAALPLYRGWTETIGIQPSGEIVRWSPDGDFAGIQPEDDRVWVLSALVEGSKRYPELAELIPQRPPDAVDCECRKNPWIASGKFECGKCGGVGWLPT